MSTLWTPDGERPIRRPAPEPAAPPAAPAGGGGDDPLTPEEAAAQMEQLRQELAHAPVEIVIANHAFGLFELAALHLSVQPPNLDAARVAVDAYGALVEGMAGRLGEPERQLAEGLSNLRMAYVQVANAAAAGEDTEQ